MKLIKSVISVCLMVCLMFIARTAASEIRPGAITLSPSIGGYVFEGNQDLENGAAYGLSFGYHFDKHWATEAVFNYVDTELDTDLDTHGRNVDTYLYHIDGLYHFMPSEKLVPYIAAGVGGIIFDTEKAHSDQDFAVNYGAGLKYFINENVALRGDVRHILSFTGDETNNNLLYTVGLTFLFGGEKAKEAPVQAPKAVEPPKVVEPPKDSDGDGVPDSLDKCPNTPKGVKVDSSGCPLDTDGDGVPDYLDKCPNTPRGVTVNEFGCWVCKGLNFDFDKWNIKPQYYPCLNEQVDFLKSRSDMRVEIQGHTDNFGSQKYNQVLSEKRAIAVMNYLVSKGIAKERLSVKGFSFSNPVATNDTEEGRAKNRRVQFNPISK